MVADAAYLRASAVILRCNSHGAFEELNREDVDVVAPEERADLLHEAGSSHKGVAVFSVHCDEDVDVDAFVRE